MQCCRGCMAAETGRASENHSETCRQRTEPAMEADDVEQTRVEVNRRVREEAGAARQPRLTAPRGGTWTSRIRKERLFRPRETMRPKLVGPPQNLSKGQSAVRSKAHALFEAHGDWIRNDLCATGLIVKE